MYILRKSTGYLRHWQSVEKTRATPSRIRERRKPHPSEPVFLRIDTVPQVDWDKQKGVYPINVVGEITQFQVVCTLEKISETYLLQAVPFMIQGLHSDNGSEYFNRRVAALLRKLLIDFTKSRARQKNDKALVEWKIGAVVQTRFGHNHIPQRWAPPVNAFRHTSHPI